MNKGVILAVIILGILAVVGVSQYIGYHNTWTDKVNLYSEQVEVDKAIFDRVWKTIKQQAGVSDRYAEQFRESYVDIMTARYGEDGREEGGGFINMLQESNPQFDASMYKQLMNTIQSERAEFTRNQQRLSSIYKELKNLKEKFPSNIFLSSKQLPDHKIVTSSKTEKVFETGEENDIELFN